MVVPELDTIQVAEIQAIARQCLDAEFESRPTVRDLLGQFSDLCGLSGTTQVEHALENVIVRANMKKFNFLIDEVASLKEIALQKDARIGDMAEQFQFLMNQY